MSSSHSILRSGVAAVKRRTGLSMAKMMLGARVGSRCIDQRYLSKLSAGASPSRALETLTHLVQRHGACPSELLVPPFVIADGPGADRVARPSNPYHGRMSQAEFEAGLHERNYTIDDLDDPICEVLTVFERPDPDATRLRVLGVGRSTVLAIEAGLCTPEALETAIANSPPETVVPLTRAIGDATDEQPLLTSKTMSVYVPPDVLVTCALITYARPIAFRGQQAVGHYAAAPAVSRSRKPGNPACSGQTARILSATEFPLPQ